MKLKNFTKKKAVAFGLAFGVAAGAGGIAAAFFSASGTGTGAALAGKATAVKITEVGAGYNSLVTLASADTYTTSTCFVACLGLSQIGNQVSLAHMTPKYATAYAQVTSVTVPLVNFGAAKILPVTLNLYGSPNTISYTFTTTAHVAAGTATHQVVTNVRFTVAGTEVFVNKQFEYGIHLTTRTTGPNNHATSSVNIARVAPSDVSVGTSTNTTWIQKKGSTTFAPATTTNLKNYLAGYVPAIQFNVVGGVVPPLYPGAPAQPVQYAITNPNTGPVHVTTITTSIKTTGTSVLGAAGCLAAWFNLTTNPYPYNKNVPHGTTVVTSGTTALELKTEPLSQNACAGKSVTLTFRSN